MDASGVGFINMGACEIWVTMTFGYDIIASIYKLSLHTLIWFLLKNLLVLSWLTFLDTLNWLGLNM